jgi:outer membrane protein
MLKYFIMLLAGIVLSSCQQKNKTGYVVTQKLFAEYKATKELDAALTATRDKQKFILDSLALSIKIIEPFSAKDREKVNWKKKAYSELYTRFEEENAKRYEEFNAGIWKQINQYITDYGKENKYMFIHGADGSGSLMYADSTFDITKDVIKYMNLKYAGNK